jgi:hypothetical protein
MTLDFTLTFDTVDFTTLLYVLGRGLHFSGFRLAGFNPIPAWPVVRTASATVTTRQVRSLCSSSFRKDFCLVQLKSSPTQ